MDPCLPGGLCLTLTSSRSCVLCCSVAFRTCWYSFSFCSSSSSSLQGGHHNHNCDICYSRRGGPGGWQVSTDEQKPLTETQNPHKRGEKKTSCKCIQTFTMQNL